mgnify:CR=1 FL=1
MKIAVPKETRPGERRVALVPESCKKLVQAGYAVAVEAGAGASAHYARRRLQSGRRDDRAGSRGAPRLGGLRLQGERAGDQRRERAERGRVDEAGRLPARRR